MSDEAEHPIKAMIKKANTAVSAYNALALAVEHFLFDTRTTDVPGAGLALYDVASNLNRYLPGSAPLGVERGFKALLRLSQQLQQKTVLVEPVDPYASRYEGEMPLLLAAGDPGKYRLASSDTPTVQDSPAHLQHMLAQEVALWHQALSQAEVQALRHWGRHIEKAQKIISKDGQDSPYFHFLAPALQMLDGLALENGLKHAHWLDEKTETALQLTPME